MLQKVGIIVFLLFIAWGWVGKMYVTPEKASNPWEMRLFTVELSEENIESDLNFFHGVNNASILMGFSVSAYFVESFSDYIDGFEGRDNIFKWLFWAIFGFIWVFFLNLLLYLIWSFLMFLFLLTMKVSLLYHTGFILTTVLILFILSLLGKDTTTTTTTDDGDSGGSEVNSKEMSTKQIESAEIE